VVFSFQLYKTLHELPVSRACYMPRSYCELETTTHWTPGDAALWACIRLQLEHAVATSKSYALMHRAFHGTFLIVAVSEP
jgi:hypothetical protein